MKPKSTPPPCTRLSVRKKTKGNKAMFETFLGRGKAQSDNEQQTQLRMLGPSSSTILFLYDEMDHALWSDLAPHIQTLALLMPSFFEWKYYLYPLPRTQIESKYKAFVHDLEKTLLFLPCTSATMLSRFFQTIKGDTRLATLLAQTHVQPIPLRAAHGVKQSTLVKPLAAYPSGNARDEACVQVVAMLEQKLTAYLRTRGNGGIAVRELVETKSPLLVAPPAHRK